MTVGNCPLSTPTDSDNTTMNINSTLVLTGATSGMGQLAAIELAIRGAHLVLTARDKTKAAATHERIHAAAPDARVDVHYAAGTGSQLIAHRRSAARCRHHRPLGHRFRHLSGIGWLFFGEGRTANTPDASSG